MFSLQFENSRNEKLYLTNDVANNFITTSQTYPNYNWNIGEDEKGIFIKYGNLYLCSGNILSTNIYYWTYENNMITNRDSCFTPIKFNTSLGICNWSSLYKFTNNTLLEEGEKVLESFKCFDTIKLYLGKRSKTTYGLPVSVSGKSLREIAELSHYTNVFKNSQFRTIILVCHSTYREKSNYWNEYFTEEDKKRECQEFNDLSMYLRTFTDKVFIIQNWESDNYKVRTPEATRRMIEWIKARQDGIDMYRKDIVSKYDPKRYNIVPFDDNVFHAVEVNRVKERDTVVYDVLPHIRVDLVSYSCYETQTNNNDFNTAIKAILSRVDRRRNYTGGQVPYCLNRFSSPLYIGEFGLSHLGVDKEYVLNTIKNVISVANSYRLPYVNFWNLYNNESGNMFGLLDSNNKLTVSGDYFKRL